MSIIKDWKIKSISNKCEITGQSFVDGDVFYTCIYEDIKFNKFIRKDYLDKSWNKIIKEENFIEPFSFWKSVYKKPAKKNNKKEELVKSSVEKVLFDLIEENSSKTENIRYVLAIMLEKNNILIQVDVKRTETRKLLFYKHKNTDDVFVIADPNINLSDLTQVQKEVSDFLNKNLKNT